MKFVVVLFNKGLRFVGVLSAFFAVIAHAQNLPTKSRQFFPGTVNRAQDLPAGRFRARLEGLPPVARAKALERLREFHFTTQDLKSMDIDVDGGIFYVDHFNTETAPPEETPSEPVIAQAAVPVTPFPASLIFHSRPGAPNVIYLNFQGENVSGTVWNTSIGRSAIPAMAFSTDSDYSSFSDSEQVAIKRIWERVAEDFAPFNVDVTTERPATLGSRTAHALITRSTDANGASNPSSSGGGVAYIDVFGRSTYNTHRPAWIYYDNLGGGEANVGEAVSHELGHNFGLGHDGKTDGTEYYSGHGSGNTSWAPIMGAGYSRNVSQWSKGEYYQADNTQDDLSLIAAKLSYRPDDHADTSGAATALVRTGTNINSTTPETDPTNSNPANKGVLDRDADVDVFSFGTGTGPVNLAINPWTQPAGTRGGNLDLLVELRDASGTVLFSDNSSTLTAARIQTNLTQGIYYLYVQNTGVGNPLSSAPNGYTSYASIGAYFISGYVASSNGAAPATVQLTTAANNSSGGTVTPPSGTYSAGANVQITATPSAYYRFVGWTNGASGTANPLTLVLQTNTTVQANFAEIRTTNFPTPHWWLAANGYTNNFENAASARGANGMPLWQSYVAGLNPNSPASQLELAMTPLGNGSMTLRWSSVPGRVYTVWWSTNPTGNYLPLANASNLSATVTNVTVTGTPGLNTFYRLQVQKP